MDIDLFERRAREIFNGIPPEYRGGVDYVVVHADALAHPELPEVYTLGECSTGELDLGMDLPDAMRSGIHLYHGSFARLAELDPDFDWEGELEETVVHELRHHRESAAGEDALEDFDYAADENFKRREGRAFDATFYRSGEEFGDQTWEVDGDLFAEVSIGPDGDGDGDDEILADIAGRQVSVPRPAETGDVTFLWLEGFEGTRGEAALVLVRRRGTWESIRRLLGRERWIVREWTVDRDDWWFTDDAGDEPGAPLA
jgi:hypothetical protein